MKLNALLLPLIFVLTLVACGESTSPGKASADTLFPLRIGEVQVQAQVMVKEGEMARGLMFRKSLPENQGMLFVYPRPIQMSFWMRNTYIPLDIGFFDSEGTLREIHPMFPHDETPVRSSTSDLQYALEVNQGWFRKNGVKPGDKLDMTQLLTATQARE